MSQTKHEILALLAAAGTEPRYRFGQNFMIDRNLVRVVAEAGDVKPGDRVIEVGPGTGTLTDELFARVAPGGHVVAVEIDRDLAALLRARFAGRTDFTLIEGDALAGKHELNPELLSLLHKPGPRKPAGDGHPERGEGPLSSASNEALRCAQGDGLAPSSAFKLVANLPYNIASPLVIELLIAGVGLLAFTVQKEVADRLRAAAGSDDYGPLSVMAQLLSRVQVLRTLPPQAFWPAPRIDSALVCLTRDDRLGPGPNEFGAFVHKLFSFRRKTLRKALALSGLDAAPLLAATGFDGQLRPEAFTPEQILQLYLAGPGSAAPLSRAIIEGSMSPASSSSTDSAK